MDEGDRRDERDGFGSGVMDGGALVVGRVEFTWMNGIDGMNGMVLGRA